MILGYRGIGKSSLAKQIGLIAIGEDQLLSSLRLRKYRLDDKNLFVVVKVDCSDATPNIPRVLKRIVNSAELTWPITDERTRLLKETYTETIDLKIIQLKTEQDYEKSSGQQFKKLNWESRTRLTLNKISDTFDSNVLVILDELDRVQDTSGLASFIKNISEPGNIKFLLVGIGTEIIDLVTDHSSFERQVKEVRVPLMTVKELDEIIDKAILRLNIAGIDIQFSKPARKRLVQIAGGFPWFVHVIGQEVLTRAWESQQLVVQEYHIRQAEQELGRGALRSVFESQYIQVVGDSPHREITLRLCANFSQEEIPFKMISDLSRIAGITNVSRIKKQLTSEETPRGAILIEVHEGRRSFVRFSNPLFKRFILMRDPIGVEVERKVRAALAKIQKGL